uniref:Uncharacterized protein n=1 Tax=Anopheles coluzzii TaxID=1518534 RepID=A0A8W7PSX5_ANOCL
MEVYNRRRFGAASAAPAVCEPVEEDPTVQDDRGAAPAATDNGWSGAQSRINGSAGEEVEDEQAHEHGTRSTKPSAPEPACTDSAASRWKIRGRTIYHPRSHLHLLLVAAVLLTHMLVNIRIDTPFLPTPIHQAAESPGGLTKHLYAHTLRTRKLCSFN